MTTQTHAKPVSNSHKVVDILYAVYLTETNREPGERDFAQSFIDEVEQILCDMVPDLMMANHGITKR